MRIESSVTSLSWIPSEAVTGMNKAAFEAGFTHYDEPPPDVLDDLEELRDADRFRFANHLRGLDRGRGRPDRRLRLRRRRAHGRDDRAARPAWPRRSRRSRCPTCSAEPERRRRRGCGSCRPPAAAPALPAPRRVQPPAVRAVRRRRWCGRRSRSRSTPTAAPSASSSGASPFPRHWVYDDDGKLVGARSGSPTSRTGTGRRSASTRRGATRTRRRSSPRSRPRSSASCRRSIMRGGAKPDDPQAQGRATCSSDRATRATSSSCCSTACSGSRSTASRSPSSGRARSSASGPCSKAAPRTSHAARGHQVPGRRGRRPSSIDRADARRAVRRATGARSGARRLSVRVHLCGVRGSTPAPGRGVRPRTAATRRAWRCRRRRRATRPTLVLDAGTGLRRVTGAARRRAVRAARSCSPTCTGTTCRGCRSSRPATATTPGSTLLLPEQRGPTAASAVDDVLARAMSPPHFPITPDGLRGDWTFGSARRRRAQGRGLHGDGARDPAQGRPHLRLPGQRRALRDRLPARPLPDRARARAPTAGASTTTPRWPWPPASDLLIHDAFQRPTSCRRGLVRPLGGGLRGRPGPPGRRPPRPAVPPRPGPHRRRPRRPRHPLPRRPHRHRSRRRPPPRPLTPPPRPRLPPPRRPRAPAPLGPGPSAVQRGNTRLPAHICHIRKGSPIPVLSVQGPEAPPVSVAPPARWFARQPEPGGRPSRRSFCRRPFRAV